MHGQQRVFIDKLAVDHAYEKTSAERGSSVHNQRIERFNRDLNRNCSQVYAPVFYDLESMHLLDIDNKTDLFSLHYVYLQRVNRTLNEFRAAYNNHCVSSEGNRTPLQLFMGEKHLLYIHNPHAEAEERAVPSTNKCSSCQ
ncbi:UNVERIFIED_CONTAM: hypothetical protein FKN15_071157 [Acipenser sinensis]